MKLSTPNAKRLAATGVLALGVGSYQLMAQFVPCQGQTVAYCNTVCADHGGYVGGIGSCYVGLQTGTLDCLCGQGWIEA